MEAAAERREVWLVLRNHRTGAIPNGPTANPLNGHLDPEQKSLPNREAFFRLRRSLLGIGGFSATGRSGGAGGASAFLGVMLAMVLLRLCSGGGRSALVAGSSGLAGTAATAAARSGGLSEAHGRHQRERKCHG